MRIPDHLRSEKVIRAVPPDLYRLRLAIRQINKRPQTSETQIQLMAGQANPVLEMLAAPGEPEWKNEAFEPLIPFVETASRKRSCH